MEVQVLSTAPLLTIAALQPGLADHGRTKLNLDFDFDPDTFEFAHLNWPTLIV